MISSDGCAVIWKLANASLQEALADLENVRLVLEAPNSPPITSTCVRVTVKLEWSGQSVDIQQKGLDLVNRRHDGGIASDWKVAQQAALLDATATQLQLVLQQRAQFEHAIAVLMGKAASAFNLAEAPFNAVPPAIPPGVPSEILGAPAWLPPASARWHLKMRRSALP